MDNCFDCTDDVLLFINIWPMIAVIIILRREWRTVLIFLYNSIEFKLAEGGGKAC